MSHDKNGTRKEMGLESDDMCLNCVVYNKVNGHTSTVFFIPEVVLGKETRYILSILYVSGVAVTKK